MSTISLFIFFVFFLSVPVSMAGDGSHIVLPQGTRNQSLGTHPAVKIESVKKGRKYEVKQADIFVILETIPDILKSCQGREKRRVTEELWQEWMRSGTCLYIRYNRPQTFSLNIRPELTVTELVVFLLPSALQGKILAKHTNTYYSPFIDCDVTRFDVFK